MKCRKAKKLVFEFIDGLEDDSKRLELEQHLAGCPACDNFASQLARSMDLLHRAPKEKTSENFEWNLRMQINQARNARSVREPSAGSMFRAWNLRYATTALAAFAVVLVAGLVLVDSGMMPARPVQDVVADRPLEIARDPQIKPSDGPPELSSRDFGSYYSPIISDPGPQGVSLSTDQGMIDSPAIMTPAELDSLIGAEMQYLTSEQRLRYMEELVNRHLQARYRYEVIRVQNR